MKCKHKNLTRIIEYGEMFVRCDDCRAFVWEDDLPPKFTSGNVRKALNSQAKSLSH